MHVLFFAIAFVLLLLAGVGIAGWNRLNFGWLGLAAFVFVFLYDAWPKGH